MGSRATPRPAAGADRWFGIKTRVHAKLLTVLTPEQLRSLNKEGVREQLGVNIERIVRDEGIPLNTGERDRLIEEVLDEVFGLGPLEAWIYKKLRAPQPLPGPLVLKPRKEKARPTNLPG